MSKFEELINIIGEEEALKLLEGAKDKSAELELLGISFKGLRSIQREVAGLSRDDLKELYALVGKLLKKPTARATDVSQVGLTKELGQLDEKQLKQVLQATWESLEKRGVAGAYIGPKTKRVLLTYEDRSAHPPASAILDAPFEVGIERIEKARTEVKTKAGYVSPLDKSFEEGMNDMQEVRTRKHKGPGRWSNPPIELVGTASIEAIIAWRKQQEEGRQA